jgi:hypothetical protein
MAALVIRRKPQWASVQPTRQFCNWSPYVHASKSVLLSSNVSIPWYLFHKIEIIYFVEGFRGVRATKCRVYNFAQYVFIVIHCETKRNKKE